MSDDERHGLLVYDDRKRYKCCSATAACDPSHRIHSYIVLILICFLSFGNSFCYNAPAALEDYMLRDLKISETQFMEFYSNFSWPSIILCFIGGYLTDKVFGVGLASVIFCSLMAIGQFVFATGAVINQLWLMNIGRIISGIGGECIGIASSTFCMKWYKGKQLNLAFGIRLSTGRVFSMMNMNVLGPLYRSLESGGTDGHVCLGLVLYIAGVTCIVGLLSAIILTVMDKRADRILQRTNIMSKKTIRLRDVLKFPVFVWLLCVPLLAYQCTVISFIGLGVVFVEMKYELAPVLATNVNSIPYIIAAVTYPIFGFIMDKSGRNVSWVIVGLLISIFSMILAGFTYLNPYVTMTVLGISYSIFTTSFASIPGMIVTQQQTATVFGILLSFQNLGLSIIPLISGAIVGSSGYLVLIVFFLILLSVGLIATLLIYLIDAARGRKLNCPAKEKKSASETDVDN